jgi:hypothetical protein
LHASGSDYKHYRMPTKEIRVTEVSIAEQWNLGKKLEPCEKVITWEVT